MTSTCADLITDVLQTIGELAQGQTPSPEDSEYCLRRLNGALDSMSQEEDFIFTRTIQAFLLTVGVGTYEIGPDAPAPFNVTRPTKIDMARILANINGVWVGIKNLRIIPYSEYVEYSDKTSTSIVPETLYYDNAMPDANIYLFDIPSQQVQLELTTWAPLQQFAGLADEFEMAPGYYEMVVLILGVAISPAYNKPVDPVTASRAQTAAERVKAINRRILHPELPTAPMNAQPGGAGPQQAPPQAQ